MQDGTHDLTRLNGSQQGQMDILWVGVGLISLIREKNKKISFLLILIFPKSVVSYSNYLYPGQLPVLPAHPWEQLMNYQSATLTLS